MKKQSKKAARRLKPFEINWGNRSIDGIKSQNSLNSVGNPYQHTTAQKEESKEQDDYSIVLRGRCNHAPQKDIELGKRSITHKAIADRLSQLVAGKGIRFAVDTPESEQPTQDDMLNLEIANELLDNGLQDSIKELANGIVYQNLASFVCTHEPMPRQSQDGAIISLAPRYITAHPSATLRFSKAKLNEFAKQVVEYHYYHKDWGYDPEKEKDKPTIPQIVSINEYLQKQDNKVAFAVPTNQNPISRQGRFVSFPVTLDRGVFDNSYPLPSWKSDSSINDIQSEFESSCIRIDYLRNGLHVFAIVNVYSALYTDMSESDSIESAEEKFKEDLGVIKALKGSFAAGRVIVNPMSTEDPTKEGSFEIQEISLSFDVDGVRYFNEEARAAALTAWGVMADLFSVTKPEKNNLRSQGEFLKIGILLLHEKIRTYQQGIEKSINRMLEYYEIDNIKAVMQPHDSSVYLAVMSQLASEYMDVNEIRQRILNIDAKTQDELDEMLMQKNGTPTQAQPQNNE